MKIVCMISSLRLGGAERQLLGLASALKAGGHDVELLTYHHDGFYEDVLRSTGVRHVIIDKKGGAGRLVKDIAAHLEKTGCEALVSFLAGTNLKACMVHRKWPHFKLIVSERSHNLHLHPHDLFRFRYYGEADLVVCNNYSQEVFIRKHYPRLIPKLCTIPNFVDPEAFCPAGDKVYGDAGQTRRIVTTARLDRRKNALGLIRAAKILKDAGRNFTIAWYGVERDDAYFRRCCKLIGKCGLEDTFRLHTATHDVASAYAGADIFCLPSFYEGTSNSLAEAMASGLPAVCSDTGDNSRYVVRASNGFLFDPHRPASIAEALDKALTLSAGQLAEFGAESRKIAEKDLGKDAFSRRYLAIFRTEE